MIMTCPNICFALKVERIKAETKNDVLFMAAGDFFQGSLWYTSFKHRVISEFVPKMHYDVISLGNHEFDDKVEGLVPFINSTRKVGLPIVCANIDFEKEPRLSGVKKSHIFVKGSHKIGIIGYLTPDTKFLSSPDNSVDILDEIKSIKQEVEVLKKEGVDIFIALGHSGFWRDQEIAKAIPELDLVVGGHTNSFLWNKEDGPPPSKEVPVGRYPTVITDKKTKKRILIVSAYAYGKYLGRIDLDFDDAGDITSWTGKPIYMNTSIPEDTTENLKGIVKAYQDQISKLYAAPVGRSHVYLDGVESSCRMKECNMGNFVNDAFVYNFINKGRKPSDRFWSKYPMAINSGGNLRTSFNSSENNGIITLGDLYAFIPFENTAVSVRVTGKTLRAMFEHSMSAYDTEMKRVEGRFLQVSGIKVVYDASKPVGQRVHSLKARCGDCEIPTLHDVVDTETYSFITNDYLTKGGDGYSMIHEDPQLFIENFDELDVDIVKRYLLEKGVVTTGLEERIAFLASSASQVVVFITWVMLTATQFLVFVLNYNSI